MPVAVTVLWRGKPSAMLQVPFLVVCRTTGCSPQVIPGNKSRKGRDRRAVMRRTMVVNLTELVRTLAAVKSLLAFGHRLGYRSFDVGRALKPPPRREERAQ